MQDTSDLLLSDPIKYINTILNSEIYIAINNDRMNSDSNFFKNIFSKSDSIDYLSKIPLLSNDYPIQSLRNKLFRYYGFVHDIYDPEFYQTSIVERNIHTNEIRRRIVKYCDEINIDVNWTEVDEEEPIIAERQCYRLSSIPGESRWANKIMSTYSQCDDKSMDVEIYNDQFCTKKRNNDELDIRSGNDNKYTKLEDFSRRTSTSQDYPNFDLSYMSVCFYDDYHGIKLGDTIEVVGLISQTSNESCPSQFENFEEYIPNQTTAYRLHAITFRVLNTSFPLYKSPLNEDKLLDQLTESVVDIRRELITFISSVLDDDVITSEYILLSIIARVYLRPEHQLLGSFPLQITGFRDKSDRRYQELNKLLENIIPRVIVLDIDSENINKNRLLPFRDMNQNQITSSPLLMSKGTLMVLNSFSPFVDSSISPEIEVSDSVRAMISIIKNQTLPISYGFYELSSPVETSILILATNNSYSPVVNKILISNSSSRISLLEEITEISLKSDTGNSISSSNPILVSDTEINKFRWYQATVRQFSHLEMQHDVIQKAEDDFVEFRQNHYSMVEEESVDLAVFNRWLIIARLIAISFGDNIITMKHWNHMKQLESSRRQQNELNSMKVPTTPITRITNSQSRKSPSTVAISVNNV